MKYEAEVLRVIDGDTVEMRIELPLNISVTKHVRLAGVNTPELKGETKEAAQKAKDYVVSALAAAVAVQVEIRKDSDKYGRPLVDLYVDGNTINQALLREGLAVPFMTENL